MQFDALLHFAFLDCKPIWQGDCLAKNRWKSIYV